MNRYILPIVAGLTFVSGCQFSALSVPDFGDEVPFEAPQAPGPAVELDPVWKFIIEAPFDAPQAPCVCELRP